MASTKKSMSLPDLLKLEGVIAKGYGLITKGVMSDTSLSNYAKAILLYLCSLSGRGEIFPGRDRIIADLGISKKTYYIGLKELIEKGYIKVRQIRDKGMFSHNIYTIPTSVTIDNGYGIIPYAVMVDDRLSHNEKVVYGYISSYSGTRNIAKLKPTVMQQHLNIGSTLRIKAVKKLRDCNYLNTTRIHSDGILTDFVIYTINTNPDEANKTKSTITVFKNENAGIDLNDAQGDTVGLNDVQGDTVGLNDAQGDTVNPLNDAREDTVKEDTVREDTAKGDNTITGFLPVTDSTIISFVPALSGQMVAAITEKIHFNDLLRIYAKEPKTLLALSSLMEFIKEVYFDPQPLYKLKNETISDHYLRYLFDYYDIHVSVNHALEAFRSKANAVINQKAFMSACFLNHLYDLSSMFPMDGDMVLAMQLRFGNAEYYGNPDYASATKTS